MSLKPDVALLQELSDKAMASSLTRAKRFGRAEPDASDREAGAADACADGRIGLAGAFWYRCILSELHRRQKLPRGAPARLPVPEALVAGLPTGPFVRSHRPYRYRRENGYMPERDD